MSSPALGTSEGFGVGVGVAAWAEVRALLAGSNLVGRSTRTPCNAGGAAVFGGLSGATGPAQCQATRATVRVEQ